MPSNYSDLHHNNPNNTYYARTDPEGAEATPRGAEKKPNAKKTALELKEIFDNEQDPQKKIIAWREYHTQLVNETVGSMEPNEKKPKIKNLILDSSKKEINEEFEYIQKLIKDNENPGASKHYSPEELKKKIESLSERKSLELSIERDCDINITSGGKLTPGQNEESGRWTIDELKVLKKTLSPGFLPANHVKYSNELQVIERAVGRELQGTDKAAGDYDQNTGKIRLFDNYIDNKGGNANQTLEQKINKSLVHEIGHSVQFQLSKTEEGRALLKQYDSILEWQQHLGGGSAKDSMISEQEKAETPPGSAPSKDVHEKAKKEAGQTLNALDQQRKLGFEDRDTHPIVVGSKRYVIDANSRDEEKNYYSYNSENMPEMSQYAKTNPNEYFAEHYMLEFCNPEQLVSQGRRAKVNDHLLKTNQIPDTEEATKRRRQTDLDFKQQDTLDKQHKIMKEQIIDKAKPGRNMADNHYDAFRHYAG